MSQTARVERGHDRGDYRRDDTPYGMTFWRRTDRPHQSPVTGETFAKWLKSGKATLTHAPEPESTANTRDPPEDGETAEDLDNATAEENWAAEVEGWSRRERVGCLELAGVRPGRDWSMARLAAELVQLHRIQWEAMPRKRPRMPRERPEAEDARPIVRESGRREARPAPWPDCVISTPGVVFPGRARAEDFYPAGDGIPGQGS